jgi:hypothetical protein
VKLDQPRDLNGAELRILEALLSEDFPGLAELRDQVAHSKVIGHCDCGCPTIDIAVSHDASPSVVKTKSRLAPIEGRILPVAGEPPGDIILFVDDRWLSCLEYVSYDDPPPREWPSAERLTIVRTD